METSKGDMVIDLHCDECPRTTKNFLKLCKIKYYNNCLFHSVTRDFAVQTGDPTGTGRGGDSIYGKLFGDQARFFEDEIRPGLKHKAKGTVSMASAGENLNASQFLITARDECDALDGKNTVFGHVSEGLDVLDAINEAYCDDAGRPWQNIRVKHTIVLDDPFDDPPGLDTLVPDASPAFVRDPNDTRLEDDWVPEEAGRDADAQERATRDKEARNRAVVLEMIGDLPDADAKPPEESLFVCKLNPVTSDEDLEIIFSRFGKVTSCDVIRDYKTGDSLCFAFVTFETKEQAEAAYFKMDNVLIDDRRIHVDFSQSMHGLWRNYKRFGKKGGTAEDGNEAGERGARRGGRVNREFVAGDGRRTYEIKGSAMGHIGGGTATYRGEGRGEESRAPPRHDRREDDRGRYEGIRREPSRSRDRDRRRDEDHDRRGRRDGSRDRRRDGDRDGDRDRDRDRHRKKDRKRERSRSRDRDRKKDRRRDRSRSRSRDASRRDGGDDRRREDAPARGGAGRAAQTRRIGGSQTAARRAGEGRVRLLGLALSSIVVVVVVHVGVSSRGRAG